MRKILFYYSAVVTLLLVICGAILHHTTGEITRLSNNNEALTSEMKLYKTRHQESAASVAALQLELEEYREKHSRDVKRIRELGVRLRRVESAAKVATESCVELSAPLRDTVFVERGLPERLLPDMLLSDTASVFRWSDNWVRIEGAIRNGRAECRVESVDTLYQIIHRVPRRFLFFRYGTKAIRQEITSSNPHTRVVYSEYIELPKRVRSRW